MAMLPHGVSLEVLFPEDTCPICKKCFLYSITGYSYKRKRGKKVIRFCSWSCMRKYDEISPDPIEKRVQDCKKRLEYLESLEGVPREEWQDTRIKNNGLPLSTMISRAETRLNSAIRRLNFMEEDEEE